MSPTNKDPYWIILADTQLGYIHWQNTQREKDYYLAFQEQCLKAAEDKKCLGIIGLGDIRERTTIQAKSLGGLNRGLKLLADANKNLLAIMGNHDKTEPSWIKEMHYPSLKDLTNPKVQQDNGFDPQTTLALNFTPRSLLIETLRTCKPETKRLVFLHQSLKEMTTQLMQSFDLSTIDLLDLGFGKNQKCTVFMGDLHNYGDVKRDGLEIVYPGSLEMTDINEGINGLKSQRISSGPHDYRKFVLHYYPEQNSWEPVEINPRPWFRGKAKTTKESHALHAKVKEHADQWKDKGCLLLTVPLKAIPEFQELAKTLPTLETRIEQYDPLCDLENESLQTTSLESSLSWKENKEKLLIISSELGLDHESIELLQSLCTSDGANHSTKADVSDAWENWYTKENEIEDNEKDSPTSLPSIDSPLTP